ncbi:MAG: InlB B-repeat-containing protein, partial [Lachnospiraceae bacterium]|nr:InlB B-repeat-containing protein [Lachnospiraceae bacterium]
SYGSSVTLAKMAECGFTLAEGYTYDTAKTWAVIRGSDDSVYCGSKGWVTSWQNGATSSSDWSKYKDGYSFTVNSGWINGTGNAHGDDTFTFVLQPKRTTSVKVVFHKNYPGETDKTYTETYYVGVSDQKFGMNLTGDVASWAAWNKSPEGYYLPGDTDQGGGWATSPTATKKGYSLNCSVSDAWIKSNTPEIHLYMVRPVKSVTVTFHKNDGSGNTYSEKYTYNAGEQNFGMYLSATAAGFVKWTRTGYAGISGWATSSTAKEKQYNICSGVQNSWIDKNCPKIDLYAVWSGAVEITVNPNGGIWNGSSQVMQYTRERGEVLELPYPTRTGYTFVGWTWIGSTGLDTRSLTNGWAQINVTQTENPLVRTYNTTNDYTNYKWSVSTAPDTDAWNRLTAGSYSITAGHTYRISGEIQVNTGSPTGVRIFHGGKENDYENEKACYYAGSGWNSFSFDRTFSSAGTGYFEFVTTNFKGKTGTLSFDLKNLKVMDVTAGTYVSMDQICSHQVDATNIAVTAKWEGNDGIAYQVHHYLMNTDGAGYSLWKSETGYGTAGSTLYLGDVAQTPEGFLDPDGMVVDGANVSSTAIKGDGSTEIYLYYDRQKYTLTVNAGTGIESVGIEGREGTTATIYYGAQATVNAETKTGYAWDSSAAWSGTLSSGDQNYTFTMPAKDVILTAKASLVSYPITYHLDGGTVTGNPTTYTVEDTFTLNNPSKNGYEFQGWTGSNGEIPEMSVTIAKGTTGNLEFYANWENLEYYLAVNGFLNGTDSDHLLDSLYDPELEQIIGTFDVWIKRPGEDWYQDAAHVTEYSKLLPYGTQWKLENVEGKTYEEMFYTYDGVKAGETGEESGALEGTISETEWVVPVFTSWHRLSIGGYCDGEPSDSIEGYGTFDISISGTNALGQELSVIGGEYIGSGISGNNVTVWEGYYPYGAKYVISDIKKDSASISSGKYADISFEGLFDTSGGAAGSLVTKDAVYSGTLTAGKSYMLQFLSWYSLIVNGSCDDTASDSVDGYGTFDVLIDGEKTAEDVSSWNKIYPYGTKVLVNDIKSVIGHTYKGVKSGNTEAVMTAHQTLVLEYITNTYTLKFESNNENGTMDPVQIRWDQDVKLPKNQFTTTEPSTFMGWLDTEDSNRASDAYEWRFTEEEHLSLETVQTLITDHGYGFTNGATITLYAIWDYAPKLEVVDRYISLDFANSGGMTEEEILRTAVVDDREDGSIAPGIHDINSLVLVNYSMEDYLNWSGEGSISETYRVTDRAGNVTEKMVRVHIVDTTAYKAPSEYQSARFINEKYIDLDLTEEEGGLPADSIWRTPEYYEVLSKTLSNKRINQEEVEIRLTLFTTTVTKPGSGEWLYEPEQIWKFSHEDVLAVKQYVKDHGPGNFYEEDALANFCVEFAHCRVK